MRDFLLLDEFASAWSEDRNESSETTCAEVLQVFWEGRFERLGPGGAPGTILVVTDQNRGFFPDQCFTGMSFGREEFLTQVFMGPAPRPEWRHWSRVITNSSGKHDPGGYRFVLNYLQERDPALLQEGYVLLRDCPLERYPHPADVYLRALGFPLAMLGRFFAERERHRPPFLIKAQGEFARVGRPSGRGGRGRRAISWDEGLLRRWYLDRVRKLSADPQHSSLTRDVADARTEIHPDITERAIRTLRREFAPEHWRTPGPRVSSKQSAG